MKEESGRSDEQVPLVLAAVLDVSSAQQLQNTLTEVVEAGGTLWLDASHVQRVDACALQLLYAGIRAATTCGVVCQWVGVSEALHKAAGLCGMVDALQLPAVAIKA